MKKIFVTFIVLLALLKNVDAFFIMNGRLMPPHNLDREVSKSDLIIIGKIINIDTEYKTYKYDNLNVSSQKIECKVINSIMKESSDKIYFHHYRPNGRNNYILSYDFELNKNYILTLKKNNTNNDEYELVTTELLHFIDFSDTLLLKFNSKLKKSRTIGCLIEICLEKFFEENNTDGLNYLISSESFNDFYLPIFKEKIITKLEEIIKINPSKNINESAVHFIKLVPQISRLNNHYRYILNSLDEESEESLIYELKNIKSISFDTNEYKKIFCDEVSKNTKNENVKNEAELQLKDYSN